MSRRLLLISCQFPPEIQGGADTQCLRQARALVKRGHDVTILTSRRKLSTPAKEDLDGIHIRRYYTICPPDLLGRWAMFSCLWILQCLVFALRRKGDFDLVHCHQGKFGLFIGAMIAWVMHVPQIVKIGNGGDVMDLRSLGRKVLFGPLFLKLGLRYKPTFVAISGGIAQDLREFGIAESQIANIANAIEKVESVHKAPSAITNFFWHGRFEPIKNIPLLLQGFAVARAKNPDIRLHLIGNGTQKDALVTLAAQLGINDSVTFVPPTSNVFPVISELDIFINTSLAEGMSNSMLESLSLGKLIVSTRVSGTTEIIDEGVNGFIIPEYTAEAVAENFLKSATFYAANHASVYRHNIAKAESQFSMESIIAQYEALYETTLAATSSAKNARGSDLRGFYQSAAKMGVNQILIFGISFIGSVILSRDLGPDGRGVIAWFVSMSSITMCLVQLGMGMVNKRYVAANPSLAGDMSLFTLWLLLGASLLAFPLFFYYGLTHEVGSGNLSMLTVAMISVPFMAIAPCLGGIMLALHRTSPFNRSAAAQKISNTLFILLLAALDFITPLTALIVLAISYVLQTGLSLYFLRGEIERRERRKLKALVHELKLKSYMAYNYVAGILLMLAAMIVPMMLASLHSLKAAGLLAACAVITEASYRVFGMISVYAFPKLMSLKKAEDRQKLKDSILLVNLWGMGAIAIVFIMISGWFVPLLFGEEFRPAVPAFDVLCVNMMLMSVYNAMYSIIQSETQGRHIILSPAALLLGIVVSALVLAPAYGAVGGAVALSIGAAAGLVSATVSLKKIKGQLV